MVQLLINVTEKLGNAFVFLESVDINAMNVHVDTLDLLQLAVHAASASTTGTTF